MKQKSIKAALCLIINFYSFGAPKKCRDSESLASWGSWTQNVLKKTCKGYEFVNIPGVEGFIFKQQQYDSDTKMTFITHASKINATIKSLENFAEQFTGKLTDKKVKLKIINSSGYPDQDSNLDAQIAGVLESDLIFSKLNVNYTATARRYEYHSENDTFIGEFPVQTTIDTDVKWINELFLLAPDAQFLNFDVTVFSEKCSEQDFSNESLRCYRRITIKNNDLGIAEKTYRADYYSQENNGFKIEIREDNQICTGFWGCYNVPFYRGTLYLDGVEGRNREDMDFSKLYWIDDEGIRTDFGEDSQVKALEQVNEYLVKKWGGQMTTKSPRTSD